MDEKIQKILKENTWASILTMTNKKQTDGQKLCECKHKEFHHIKTYDGKYICGMGGCKCEQFKEKENEEENLK